MEHLSKSIVKYVDQVYLLNNTQKELMEFGIQSILEIGINILISILILCKMGMLKEGFIFFCAFIPLRTLSGGYHSDTYLRCLTFSVITLILAMQISKHIAISLTIIWCMSLLLAACIGKIGPVVNDNRPISSNEYRRFKRGLGKVLLIITIVSAIAVIFQLKQIANIIFVCLMLILSTLIIGKMKYKKYQMDN